MSAKPHKTTITQVDGNHVWSCSCGDYDSHVGMSYRVAAAGAKRHRDNIREMRRGFSAKGRGKTTVDFENRGATDADATQLGSSDGSVETSDEAMLRTASVVDPKQKNGSRVGATA